MVRNRTKSESRIGAINSGVAFSTFAIFTQVVGAVLFLQTAKDEANSAGFFSLSGFYADSRSIAFCWAGSAVGAWLSIAAFPGHATTGPATLRQLGAKFGSSMAVAILFGPWCMESMGVTSSAAIAAVSGIFSLCGVTVLHELIPYITNRITKRGKDKVDDVLGKDDGASP